MLLKGTVIGQGSRMLQRDTALLIKSFRGRTAGSGNLSGFLTLRVEDSIGNGV